MAGGGGPLGVGVGEAGEIYYLYSKYFSLFSSFLRACLQASASAPIFTHAAENNDLSILRLFYSELTRVLFAAFRNVERRNLLATVRDLKETMLVGTALSSWQTGGHEDGMLCLERGEENGK